MTDSCYKDIRCGPHILPPPLPPAFEDLMQASALAHKHRHYKTLILLVVCMTAGAFFLFWLGQMAPVTPLRGKLGTPPNWNRIAVRTAPLGRDEPGFFHYRIDESGQLYQTSAWKNNMQDPRQQGAIEIVLTVNESDAGISRAQEKSLTRLLSNLRRKFAISADQVRLSPNQALASAREMDHSSRVGL